MAAWINAAADRFDEIGLIPLRNDYCEIWADRRSAERTGLSAGQVGAVTCAATHHADQVLAIVGCSNRRCFHRLGNRWLCAGWECADADRDKAKNVHAVGWHIHLWHVRHRRL